MVGRFDGPKKKRSAEESPVKRDERTARLAIERKRLRGDMAFSINVVLAWARQRPFRERAKLAWLALRGTKKPPADQGGTRA